MQVDVHAEVQTASRRTQPRIHTLLSGTAVERARTGNRVQLIPHAVHVLHHGDSGRSADLPQSAN